MNTKLRQAIYLIADEMRGMASIGKHFANNPYEVERAHNMMRLAAKLAALVDSEHDETTLFEGFMSMKLEQATPGLGADAAVFNEQDEILLIQRKSDKTWAMPGGISEIGDTLPETALKELWEEAGLRGRVGRVLGIFDAQRWGSLSPIHHMITVFEIKCENLQPEIGIEAINARFFSRDTLPVDNMHPSHVKRVPQVFESRETGCYFDAADSLDKDMLMTQRPDKK